jgi:hypothetical protein
MNFDDCIKAHSNWKLKLAAYIAKPDGSLKSSVVGNDHGCDLGKWIDGEGTRFAQVPEFTRMKEAHVRFHSAAGDIIRKADGGQKVTEEIALGGHSPYASASTEVISAILAMKAHAK